MDDDKYNCTVCKISLTSWQELQQHLQESTHLIQTEATHEAEEVRAAMAEGFLVLQKIEGSQKMKCLLCKISIEFKDSLPLYNHIQEMEHKRLASIGLPEQEKKSGGGVELEAQQKLEAMALDRTLDVSGGSYNCLACNVQAKSIQQLQQHMEGGKHKLRANDSPEAEEVKAQLDDGFLRQKSGLKINCLLCKIQVDFLDDVGPIYQHIQDSEHIRLAELGLGAVPTEVEVLTEEELDAKLNADESPEAETVRQAIKAGFLTRKERGKFLCNPCKATLDFKEVRPLNEHLSGSKHEYNAYMWKMWKGRRNWRARGRGFYPPPPAMWGGRGGGHPYPGFYEDYYANPGFDGGPGQSGPHGNSRPPWPPQRSGPQRSGPQGAQDYYGPMGRQPPYPPPWMVGPGPFWMRGRGRGRGRGGRGRGRGGRGRGRGGRGRGGGEDKAERKSSGDDDQGDNEDVQGDSYAASAVGAGDQQSYGLENLQENIEAALEGGDNQMPPKKRVRNIEVIQGSAR